MALHDLEELDNDLGARSDQDLTLAGLLGIVDGVEGVVENGSADHLGGIDEKEILKSELEMRYLPQGKHMLDSEWPISVESALSDPSTRVQPAHCRRGSSVSRNASQSLVCQTENRMIMMHHRAFIVAHRGRRLRLLSPATIKGVILPGPNRRQR